LVNNYFQIKSLPKKANYLKR